MLYCILAFLLFLAIAFLLAITIGDDEDTCVSILAILILILIMTPMVNQIMWKGESSSYEEIAYEITGLELQSYQEENLQGRFILGSGYINSYSSIELQYIFFANTEHGKQLKTVKGTNLYIRETDEETPKLINIKTKIRRKANWIDQLWGHNKGEEIVYGTLDKGQILVVPTNTIKIEYNVEI